MERQYTITLSADDLEDLMTALDDSIDRCESEYDMDDDEILDYVERCEWLIARLQRLQAREA